MSDVQKDGALHLAEEMECRIENFKKTVFNFLLNCRKKRPDDWLYFSQQELDKLYEFFMLYDSLLKNLEGLKGLEKQWKTDSLI